MSGNQLKALVLLCCIGGAGQTYANSEEIQGDSSGYWSSGVMIGQKGDIATRGLFIPTKEMTFLLGSEPGSGDKNYTPEKMQVSTYEQSVFDQLQGLPANEPVVLRYVHPFPLNPFHWTQSKYFVTTATVAGQPFEQSQSYQKFGYHFHQPTSQHQGAYESGQKSGKVVHVSRWGLVFGKTCTAYLHEGGTKQVVVTKYRDNSSYKFNPETMTNEKVTEKEPYQDTMSVPNISTLNIYSESGCKFAEDAAISMVPVSVHHSRKLMEIWNAHELTIHSMKVSPNKPPYNHADEQQKGDFQYPRGY